MTSYFIKLTKAATGGVLKKVVGKNFAIFTRNTCAGASLC